MANFLKNLLCSYLQWIEKIGLARFEQTFFGPETGHL